jgi:hypothetical protein
VESAARISETYQRIDEIECVYDWIVLRLLVSCRVSCDFRVLEFRVSDNIGYCSRVDGETSADTGLFNITAVFTEEKAKFSI